MAESPGLRSPSDGPEAHLWPGSSWGNKILKKKFRVLKEATLQQALRAGNGQQDPVRTSIPLACTARPDTSTCDERTRAGACSHL